MHYCDAGVDTVVAVYSANTVDYIIAVLACHKLGAIASCANPSYQPSELSYQLEASKSTAMFVGEEALNAGFTAAKQAGISSERLIVLQTPATCQNSGALKGGSKKTRGGAWTLEGLLVEAAELVKGKASTELDKDRHTLKRGEAKSKIAFLSFSSGTTGLPVGILGVVHHHQEVLG